MGGTPSLSASRLAKRGIVDGLSTDRSSASPRPFGVCPAGRLKKANWRFLERAGRSPLFFEAGRAANRGDDFSLPPERQTYS